MRLGICQINPVFGDKKKNIEKVVDLLERKGDGDFLVLPELFNTGYNFISREEAYSFAENDTGETITILKDITRKKKMGIYAGVAEKEGNNLYNSSYLIANGDVIGKYRKIHLYGREKEIFNPGNMGFSVISYKGAKFGMMICFDWIFPEVARTLALKGAQIILHSANLILPYCQDAMRTRAIENRVFIATANRIGREERGGISYRFTGRSQVIAPDGEVLIKMNEGEESILWVEINPESADNKDINAYNNLFKDRREEYYFK